MAQGLSACRRLLDLVRHRDREAQREAVRKKIERLEAVASAIEGEAVEASEAQMSSGEAATPEGSETGEA